MKENLIKKTKGPGTWHDFNPAQHFIPGRLGKYFEGQGEVKILTHFTEIFTWKSGDLATDVREEWRSFGTMT